MFVGAGTALNVATVLVGSSIGVALGSRLPERTRDVVTDALGLVTLLIAALSAFDVRSAALADEVGSSAPVLIVLGALLIGGIAGSLLGLEARLEGVGAWLQRALTGRRSDGPGTLAAEANPARARFVEGFVTASLVFCVGPLTILGSLSDGLGRGIDQLALKATLDGFASIAFAASLGWGVAASALAVAVIQGALTLLGVALGDVLPEAHVAALTATGGLVLVGVALRLLRIRQVPAADLLPALVVAPVLVWVVAGFR
ncbi:MAG TPA: DUF554 domain-containing protein [Motilibacteraceae bacterium]|nr:DUF554 domain-containing protein [Motilibacteraceae bacterium]